MSEAVYVQVWGYKSDRKQMYSFVKNAITQEMVKDTFKWHLYKLEDVAVLEEGICGENSKAENRGKKFSAWKMKENGAFVQGTFKIVDEEK